MYVLGVCCSEMTTESESLNFIEEFVLKMEVPNLKVLMLDDNYVTSEGFWKLFLSLMINNLDILSMKNNLVKSITNPYEYIKSL